jgi:hypothetical protein
MIIDRTVSQHAPGSKSFQFRVVDTNVTSVSGLSTPVEKLSLTTWAGFGARFGHEASSLLVASPSAKVTYAVHFSGRVAVFENLPPP